MSRGVVKRLFVYIIFFNHRPFWDFSVTYEAQYNFYRCYLSVIFTDVTSTFPLKYPCMINVKFRIRLSRQSIDALDEGRILRMQERKKTINDCLHDKCAKA